MKLFAIVLVISLGLVFSAHSRGLNNKPRLETCDPNSNCVLPDCLCANIEIPGGLQETKIPQLVFLTFDDGITVGNYPLYQQIFDGKRKNPNGVPISGTFFVTHEYNDYNMTHQLYRQGHEIALHSITHKSDVNYWKTLNETMWKLEVEEQKAQMARFAKIPEDKIVGFRSPFLQGGGDPMYNVLQGAGFKYESSRPSWRFRPVLWPYTADFQTIQDCQIEPCPVEAHPGFWVHPLVDYLGGNDSPCAFVDTCLPTPESAEDTYNLLRDNFDDHYNSGKAPFGVYTHAAWILNEEKPFIRTGYLKFIDEILKLKDVYIVSVSQGLDWIQNPVNLTELENGAIDSWQSQTIPNGCNFVFNCNYNSSQTPPELSGERLMNSCVLCPKNYPWLGNPLGN